MTLSRALVVPALLSALFCCPVSAQGTICSDLESVRPGDFLHGQTDTHLSTVTRRPVDEPPSIGQSMVKGGLARRLSGEFNGVPVRWSGAIVRGPIACGGFNAFQILVDPAVVRISDLPARTLAP